MLSRRSLVARLAAVAAGGSAVVLSSRGEAVAATAVGSMPDGCPDETPLSADREIVRGDALVAPLTIGSKLAGSWSLAAIGDVEGGAAVITLSNGMGRIQRVHVCLRQGERAGVTMTDQFDLVLMNGGAGDLPTDETIAHAVAKLGRVIAANEDRPEVLSLKRNMSSHGERLAMFSGMDGAHLR